MGIHYKDLFQKSIIYIEKAITSRDEGNYDEFQLWASISLELLGKATLASIHPSLVVDPNSPKGLLVACGYIESDDFKTITAKTLYDRLSTWLKITRFDNKTKDFCMTLSNRRNAELHSGLIPFEGINIEGWTPKFWDVCKILLEFQDKSLSDFIGHQEAKNAEFIINDHTQTLQKTIESRIDRHKLIYLNKYSNHSPQEIAFDLEPWEGIVDCPSCGNSWIAEGEMVDSEFIEYDSDDPWIANFKETYDITEFRCLYCDLKLNGYDEVEFSGMDTYFTKMVQSEPDYEPDYGND